MRQETFTLSAKELQRVAVISHCVKGDLACAGAAELLDLSPRQVKRLKSRYRQGGEAAMAHASRGRPSPRRLPEPLRQSILHLARTRYRGFNDHHLCEKLTEVQGFSLSRETLRRLLRSQGLGSPRKRRAPAHRQRRLRSARQGELVLLDGSPHDWLEGRGPLLTALGLQDDATGKILAAQFFPTETSEGYFRLLQRLLRRYGIPPWPSTATATVSSSATTITGPSKNNWLAAASPRSSAAHSSSSGSPTSPPTLPRPRVVSNVSGACSRIGSSANSVWPGPRTWLRLTKPCAASWPITTAAWLARRETRRPLDGPLPRSWIASAAWSMSASSATTTSCNGRGAASTSRPSPGASASRVPRSSSIKAWMAVSRSFTATPPSNTRPPKGVTFSCCR